MSAQEQPVIRCDSVYKIFGENADKMLRESGGNVDAAEFQKAGCVVGVNNASFEVHKGEMLVVMGLSGSGKSTLALYLSSLLSSNTKERKYATKKLQETNELFKDFTHRFNVKRGWVVVKHVCGLESPANSILVSIYTTLKIEFDLSNVKSFDDERCLEEIHSL